MSSQREEALKRHLKFWEKPYSGEGSYISVECPKSDAPKLQWPRTPREKWLDIDWINRRIEYRMRWTNFYLDAYPGHFINTGAGVMAAWLGADTQVNDDTIWFGQHYQPISDWDTDQIQIDRSNEMYQITYQMTEELCKQSDGRFSVSIADLGGNMDILASLRGAENLLMDLYDYPDEVKHACEEIDRLWIEEFHKLTRLIGQYSDLHTSWMLIQNEHTWYPLQCDFCTMVSPPMFREFILPSLKRQAACMENAIYHLDGPEEIQHLDDVLTIPNLHAVQWVPLPAADESGEVIQDYCDDMALDVYRRILRDGKKVVLLGVPIDQIETIFERMGTDDGFFITAFAKSEAEAEYYVPLFDRHRKI